MYGYICDYKDTIFNKIYINFKIFIKYYLKKKCARAGFFFK